MLESGKTSPVPGSSEIYMGHGSVSVASASPDACSQSGEEHQAGLKNLLDLYYKYVSRY